MFITFFFLSLILAVLFIRLNQILANTSLSPLTSTLFILLKNIALGKYPLYTSNKFFVSFDDSKLITLNEKITLMNFMNIKISKIIEPELTTIEYPGFLMGEVAATQLISHLQGKSDVKQLSTIIINSELIIRESSLKSGKK